MATRAEHRACLADGDAIEFEREALMKNQDGHHTLLRQLMEEGRVHNASQATLDTTSQEAVDAFNAKAEAFNVRSAELNAISAKQGEEMLALNARVAELNRRCGGKLIKEADRKAVEKERAAAGKPAR